MEQSKEVTLEQYFQISILCVEVDPDLAHSISNCVTPLIKDLKETKPNNQHKSDYGEASPVLATAADGNPCIEELTNKILEVGNVYIQNQGLGSFKRYFSAWVNSYDGTQYKGIHNHCRNVNDVHGVYYVEADESMSPLIIHHPSPFMQGQAISTEYNYSSVKLKPQKGRIYMMPSWLMHEVHADSANESGRISIGFKYEQIMKDSYEDQQYIIEQQKPYDMTEGGEPLTTAQPKPYAGSAGGGKF